uniref:Uncharacterized protein n=1 Tax=Engystomops pustulosus TaxID=76066 RepID=A0AAV6YTD3_ENGPU|nr:hypothetical protein GDO81_023206 [Engystomops pustulosus]
MPSLIIPLPLDFDSEFDPDPYERINSRKTPSPRYPMNTKSGKKVHLRPFTASGHCFSEDYEKEKRELKRLTKPRCASADRRRPWRSEVQSIPDLDTLCHMGHSGPILSSLGAPFSGSPRDVLEDSGTTERPEVSACGADMRPSPLPDTLGCIRAENMTEHPPRGNIQKAAAVSLCLED